MCYNASNSHAIKELERIANRPIWDQVKIRWEPQAHVSAFARPWWPVISTEHPGYIDMKQWGLLPPYAREDAKEFLAKTPTYNAISEEAAQKRVFKGPWERGQRCLVLVTGFREWQHRAVPGRKTPHKVPYDITLKGAEVFALGGLWDGDTYTILTRAANPLMAEIHNTKRRMPVVITPAHQELWLSLHATEADVQALCAAAGAVDLEAHEAVEPPKQGVLF